MLRCKSKNSWSERVNCHIEAIKPVRVQHTHTLAASMPLTPSSMRKATPSDIVYVPSSTKCIEHMNIQPRFVLGISWRHLFCTWYHMLQLNCIFYVKSRLFQYRHCFDTIFDMWLIEPQIDSTISANQNINVDQQWDISPNQYNVLLMCKLMSQEM